MGVPAIQGLYRPEGFKLQSCCGFLELKAGRKLRWCLRERIIPENFERRATLVRGFVVAGGTAWLAVHQPVLANTDVECRLAETTKFVAFATVF